MLCGFIAPALAAGDQLYQHAPAGAPQIYPGSDAAGKLFDFDIPAQPLNAALRLYAALTRQSTLFRSELVAGQISSAVHGLYSSEAALRLLLDGTGLVAEKTEAGPDAAFVLKADNPPAAVPGNSLDRLAGGAGYLTMMQARVWQTLCADTRTAPGNYRSLLRFRVDATGYVQHARLLGSTGDRERDGTILAALRRVHLERSPPPDMPQPVTLLITPRDPANPSRPDAGQDCGNDNEAARP
jgi:hypothetical protein